MADQAPETRTRRRHQNGAPRDPGKLWIWLGPLPYIDPPTGRLLRGGRRPKGWSWVRRTLRTEVLNMLLVAYR